MEDNWGLILSCHSYCDITSMGLIAGAALVRFYLTRWLGEKRKPKKARVSVRNSRIRRVHAGEPSTRTDPYLSAVMVIW